MIEACLMGGVLPGPWSRWEFVGSASVLATGSARVEAQFPLGVRDGDLVIAVMSPRNEITATAMGVAGWQRWATGVQDLVCTARYSAGLSVPAYTRAGPNPIFVTVLAFRADGWSTVKLQSHKAPAEPVAVATRMQNELLLCIGVTPQTTRGWAVTMNGADPVSREERTSAPALRVYSASVDFPRQITGISVDALSGAERNLILTVN